MSRLRTAIPGPRPPESSARRGGAPADWCRSHGVLLVADEVQTGFCRTGDWSARDHEGVVPDLVTTAKGIAGGLPPSPGGPT